MHLYLHYNNIGLSGWLSYTFNSDPSIQGTWAEYKTDNNHNHNNNNTHTHTKNERNSFKWGYSSKKM